MNIPLKDLNSEEMYIWYLDQIDSNKEERYNVSNIKKDILGEFNDIIFKLSSTSSNYNNFIMNENNIDDKYVSELITSFSNCSLPTLFAGYSAQLFNKFNTIFIFLPEKYSSLISRISKSYFNIIILPESQIGNTIRLVSVNAHKTLDTQSISNNLPKISLNTYYYGNENNFSIDDLKEGHSINSGTDQLILIGNNQSSHAFFKETFTVLELEFKDNFTDEHGNKLEI